MPRRPQFVPAGEPLFKWAGGKRWLTPILAPEIQAYLAVTGGRYIEPFLGGGAVALALGAPGMVLADVETPLVEAYRAIRDDCHLVTESLWATIHTGTELASYLRVRTSKPAAASSAAARLLYLNRLCFNGLYRTNRKGEFNVPYGRYKRPSFPSASEIERAATALATSELLAQDFEATIDNARSGDCIYADPPYHSHLSGFVSYHQRPFLETDHLRLAAALQRASNKGAWIISTNSDTEFVRKAYEWTSVSRTLERRAINSNPHGRGHVHCVLIGVTRNERINRRQGLAYDGRSQVTPHTNKGSSDHRFGEQTELFPDLRK